MPDYIDKIKLKSDGINKDIHDARINPSIGKIDSIVQKEDEVVVLDGTTILNSSYRANEDEIRKAKEGKVVINYNNYFYRVTSITDNIITFSTTKATSSNVPHSSNEAPITAEIGWWSIVLNLNTRTYSEAQGHSNYIRTVQNTDDNFFAANITPAENGKKIVRERNVYGKLIPPYSASDAGKILKINEQGNFPILVEDESLKGIEVVDYQKTTALTTEQVEKAKVGKLAVRYYQGNYLMLFYGGYSSTTVTFRTFAYMSTSTKPYANFAASKEIDVLEIPLNTSTRMFGDVVWNVKVFAEDSSENVFAVNVAPSTGSKRIVRELNIAGKIIPSYTTLDANKYVAINSEGNGVELVEEEFATDLEAKRLFRNEYSITVNITNGIYSGDSTIWTRETGTITITPNDNYALPGTITVTNASYTYDDITGIIVLSNVTDNVVITCTCPEIPSKGDLITMDGKTFRVLKTDGRKCDVMCLTDETCAYYDDNPQTFNFEISDGTYAGLKYGDSTLDKYLNETWFSALSSEIQDAIIEQELLQDLYRIYDSGSPTSNTVLRVLVGSSSYRLDRINTQSYHSAYRRKVRSLDVNDVAEFFYSQSTGQIYASVLKVFAYGPNSELTESIGFSSANYISTQNPSNTHCSLTKDGRPASNTYSHATIIRPVFKLDISQVTWTMQSKETGWPAQ